MKAFAFGVKRVLTPADQETARFLDTLSHEDRLKWRQEQVATYRKGDCVRAVLGGYTGPWLYGVVTEVNTYHVAFKTIDDDMTMVASPGPMSGLERISCNELADVRSAMARARF